MALDTLANVKLDLGILGTADDAALTRMMQVADDFIVHFCDRSFEAATRSEDHPARGRFVFLHNWPVESIEDLRVDPDRIFGPTSIVPPERWLLHVDRGVIECLRGAFLEGDRPGSIRAVYSTTGEVRGDLRHAYARLAGFFLRRARTEASAEFRNIAQQKRGDSFVIFSSLTEAAPADALRILERYRCPAVP